MQGDEPKTIFIETLVKSQTWKMETPTISNGVQENVGVLSEASTMQKLENGLLSCDDLLAGYKEARVVLVDLKYSDYLTPQQRRELVPRRRRPSSVTSQRTKNLLKEIAKEEAAPWMEEWTSSSVESVSFATSSKQSKSKRGKGRSSKKRYATKSKVCIKQEIIENEQLAPVKKRKQKSDNGPKRPVGRPRKKAIKLEPPKTPSIITISSTGCGAAVMKTENEQDLRLNPINNIVKIEKTRDLRLNIMNSAVQQESNPFSGKGREKRVKKKNRKISDTNNLKHLFETFLADDYSTHNKNESEQSQDKIIKQEMLSPPASVKKEFIEHHEFNVTLGTGVEGENKFNNTAKISFKTEMSPSFKPSCTDPCTLDSIDQTIEAVVAASNISLPAEDHNVVISTPLVMSININNLREENPNDPQVFGTKEKQCNDLKGLQNGGLDAFNMSIGSSGSTPSTGSGKRKLPEIIQDSLLPRGTIDIPSVRPKTPCYSEKRKKNEKSNISEKAYSLPNNSQTISNSVPPLINLSEKRCLLDKSGEVKLSKALKKSSSQPEVAFDFHAKPFAINRNNRHLDDALNNNNRCAATINGNGLQKSNGDHGIYSSLSLTSPPHSNVSDEAKALLDLLSHTEKPSAIDNSCGNTPVGSNENSKNFETRQLAEKNTGILRQISEKANIKPTEKLTLENLNRFNNTTLGDKNPNKPVNSTLHAQSKTISKVVQVENGEGDCTSGGSEKSRKRKWVPNESDVQTDTPKKRKNGKVRLVRKHWENQAKWILVEPSTSSVDGEPCSRLSDPKISRKTVISMNTGPVLNLVRVETANRNINNNVQKTDSVDNVLQKSGNEVHVNLPKFGESSVNKVATPESSDSSDPTSSLGQTSSKSDSSSSLSRRSDSNPPEHVPQTIEEALEKDQDLKKKNLMKEFKIPLLSKKDGAGPSIEKTNNTGVSKKQELQTKKTKSTDRNVHPVTVELGARVPLEKTNCDLRNANVEIPANHENSKVHRIDTSQNSDDIDLGLEINTVEPMVDVGKNEERNNLENSFEEELEELVDAQTLARKKNTAGSVKNNKEEEEEEEEEEDCISLDTESICMSGIESPPLHKPSKISKLPSSHEQRRQPVEAPVAPEPYARMKSANIGKFVAENVRECEEIFEVFKENAIISATTFDGSSVRIPVDSVLQKPPEKGVPTTHRDLRTTLNSRSISRDIPSLFRGKCYAWLRHGTCNSINPCRFAHCLEPNLGNIQKYDLKNIEEILTYAANQGYSSFIELVQNKAMTNMTTSQIKCLYYQLCRKKLLTVSHIENFIDGLQIRRLTSADILATLIEFVSADDMDVRSKIQLAMYKKVEPGNCWNVLEKLIIQARPPVPVIEAIMEETIRKNCKNQARAINDKVLRRMTVQQMREIRKDLWDNFQKLKTLNAATIPTIAPTQNAVPDTDFGSAFRNNISPESPKSDRAVSPVENFSIKSPSIEPPPMPNKIDRPHSAPSKGSRSRSSSDFEDTSYNLQPIDKLSSPKCPYRDYLWKFHWDLQGMQEGLKHKDYAHVVNILENYAAYPNRLPHIEGFYKILIKEITSAKHHLDEIVRLTVQSGSSDQLRLYVYDLGIYVLTKLADIGAWIHAYELLKTFRVYGSYNTCAFTLLAAQIYIANRRPSKALDLLEKSRLVFTNGRKWREVQCKEDEYLRVSVLDLLLYSLCDGYADDALRLLDFILRDQCSTFKPINLIPHVERIVRLLLSGKQTSLIIDVGRLILQAKLFVSAETFRGLINRVFHEDRVLAKQLHRYATWLGTYNKAKIDAASCVHMVINVDWTEEETFLMISSLLENLYINIGHAVDRMKVRQLNVYLIFEAIPSERQLSIDVASDGLLSTTAINKRRATVKSVLDRFDPKIKMVQRYQGRICKLQSQSLIAYLKSGHVTF